MDAMDRLVAYPWPENLRELHAVVDAAFAAEASTYIKGSDLPPAVQNVPNPARPRAGDAVSMRDLEVAHLREVLGTHSLQQAAEILGLDLQALYRRRKQYGLE